MAETLVLLEAVTFCWQQETVIEALDCSFTSGEVVGLIGPPGAGKSTLLKLIAGLIEPARGRIWRHTQLVGMSFQNNALFDFTTVRGNVAFPLTQLAGHDSKDTNLRVDEVLAKVGLTDVADFSPRELSGGMQRRLGIARAIVGQPRIALFDNPSAGLDPVTSAQILSLLSDYAAQHDAVVLIVSSEVDTLLHWVDRLLLLAAGRLRYDGLPRNASASDDELVHQFISGSEEGLL